ncbi:MAG TPA: MM0924 family protein [Pyrinomonadaceae bacterium]|nr:MM0924 family protein [Pyrinomonadaceae bacterium]
MQEFLSKMIGRRLDLFCEGALSLRGEALEVDGGLLYLKDEDERVCYVALDKIVAVWEAQAEEHRAGFVSGSLK